MKKTYIDLVLDSGELVRIEVPQKYENECWDHIENSMKTRGWFSPCRWEGCGVKYLGMDMERINMAKVVGTL